ncbi:Abi-domain-containing protein [Metschnikowia bicuspidata var. bicuspidata NRRL YB-4993]|uniref:intramembrane prenyl-peptidase Rce1 n=1 Tax=Metschnikowia bicuspidata var. bicuspidata NRRL YB-4993 TaxID=869754 RepID=A0A1A0H761_9ASCO|nr:Abi-domain-containing protein [Metschnikowia bicuspidata var. bicuspidata NRRL YB-4993]OBA19738.1 Abi-domain-containing protein [Metschnikowia bicuspidata var. bicuspidata NRRL YB-4993]
MFFNLLVGAVVASLYVAAIKLSVPVHVVHLERSNPIVIRFRIRRIFVLCGILLFAIPVLSVQLNGASTYGQALRNMGLFPGFTSSHDFVGDVMGIVIAWLKIASLYIGPICAYFYIDAQGWRADFQANFCTLAGIRDHVFAPITEEFVYRAALVAVLAPVLLENSLIFYSPLLFGLAHVHHGINLYCQEQVPLISAIAASTFQLVYTTAFGILANLFYVRSGYNLWCPIVVHATCNLLGFPSFEMKHTHPRFFYVYCVLLVFGIVAFWKLI